MKNVIEFTYRKDHFNPILFMVLSLGLLIIWLVVLFLDFHFLISLSVLASIFILYFYYFKNRLKARVIKFDDRFKLVLIQENKEYVIQDIAFNWHYEFLKFNEGYLYKRKGINYHILSAEIKTETSNFQFVHVLNQWTEVPRHWKYKANVKTDDPNTELYSSNLNPLKLWVMGYKRRNPEISFFESKNVI